LGSGFRLYKSANTNSDFLLGRITFQPVPEFGGQWVVSCAVDLDKTKSTRHVGIRVGNRTDLDIQIPLPRHPGPAFKQWSAWSKTAVDYEFRFRIQRKTDYQQAHPDPTAVFMEARGKALEAMSPDAALAQWLPFFENERERAIANLECAHPEVAVVAARPDELLPLLRSKDPTIVRRAVFAAATLKQIPPSLIDVLAASGRHAIDLIHQARANSLPNDPDSVAENTAYTFFFYWNDAMDRAGDAALPVRRAVLEEIAREVHGATGHGSLQLIAEQVTKELEKLGSQAPGKSR
jgi:hypothetical protein